MEGAPPVKCTVANLTPIACSPRNSDRWSSPRIPVVDAVILPGFALASSITSWRVLYLLVEATAMTPGSTTCMPTGWKDFRLKTAFRSGSR